MRREPERRDREAGHGVDGQQDHPAQRVMRRAGGPGLPVVGEGGLAQAYPAHHSAHEAVAFRHRVEVIHGSAVHQSEIAAVEGDVDLDDGSEHAVERGGAGAFEPRLARPAAPLAIDHVEALVHLEHESAEQFGRILEVGVEDEDAPAAAELEARAQRDLVAVIAGQIDRHDVTVLRGQREDHVPGPVRRSVVHQNDLVGGSDRLAAGVGDAAVQNGDVGLLVVAGDHHRERPAFLLAGGGA